MIASAASWFATDLVVVKVHLVTASLELHRNHSHSWIRLLSNNLFLLFSETVCEKSLSGQPSAVDRMRLTPYLIIVADTADAVSVNFSGLCKFFSDLTRKFGNLLCILP